jgi:hypothetical protein
MCVVFTVTSLSSLQCCWRGQGLTQQETQAKWCLVQAGDQQGISVHWWDLASLLKVHLALCPVPSEFPGAWHLLLGDPTSCLHLDQAAKMSYSGPVPAHIRFLTHWACKGPPGLAFRWVEILGGTKSRMEPGLVEGEVCQDLNVMFPGSFLSPQTTQSSKACVSLLLLLLHLLSGSAFSSGSSSSYSSLKTQSRVKPLTRSRADT